MHRKIFIEQLKRSKKTVFYLLLLIVATAFFVTSLNLYHNSTGNLQKAEETYSTLAVTELYGDIDQYGNLVEENSQTHVGYKAAAVKGYDISQIIGSESVESWDLRTQYGAYIEDRPALRGVTDDGMYVPRASGQLVRFRLIGQTPITLSLVEIQQPLIKLEILDDAAGCFRYQDTFRFHCFLTPKEVAGYADQIKQVNRSDETTALTLYPDVEYVACLWPGANWTWSAQEEGILEVCKEDKKGYKTDEIVDFNLCYPWTDYGNFHVAYDKDQEYLTYDDGYAMGSPFPLQRWEDVQNDPKLQSYYDKTWEDLKIQNYVYQVQLTNDITSVPAYHIGGASLSEGRMITSEEYLSGAKVCMVSEEMANFQNWEIGDKLNIHLFETFYQPAQQYDYSQPLWDSDTREFIHQGEYEIVGFYAKNPVTGNSGISPNTLDMSTFNIYLPEKSVPAVIPVEERYVHSSLFSVKIQNGSIDAFLDDMEAKGITTEQEGQFTPKFTFYDQGYSLVEPGLRAMNSTAKLLVVLSTALLLITSILIAYFFWQNQRQTVGIFRLLGGTKKQAVAAVLVCALLLCGIGAAVGGSVGYGVAQAIGSDIMEENVSHSERDSLFQAYVLPAQEEQESVVVTADPMLTLGACGSVLLFPLFLLGFVSADINKEPRELLPKSKA
ncbi:FtsX-like permease family protein [uncultured Negativibacillus sp.]|uniref:FtsX-like permease family protein n=1 Tax=uncultured Negativibacillus sp. TaxID=1980696 RepID=UPI0025EA3364|nr:FtsX-like permease family protein [uncultured Negativibacillus sp.]